MLLLKRMQHKQIDAFPFLTMAALFPFSVLHGPCHMQKGPLSLDQVQVFYQDKNFFFFFANYLTFPPFPHSCLIPMTF